MLHEIRRVPGAQKQYRINLQRVREAQQFWFANCEASASCVVRRMVPPEQTIILRPIHWLSIPLVEMYRLYATKVAKPFGYHSFVAMRPKQVKDAKNRSCLCEHCEAGKEAQKRLPYGSTPELETTVREYNVMAILVYASAGTTAW